MGIVFNPPLGQVVHVPLGDAQHRDAVHLCFRAYFESEHDLQSHVDMKLQIWSNLPAPNKAPLEWSETTFESDADTSSATTTTLHLVGKDNGPLKAAAAWHARITVPFSGQTHFAYTYRLVDRSGNVRWLGSYGGNGQLLLDRTLSLDSTHVGLVEGWNRRSDGSYRWNGVVEGQGEVKVAELRGKNEGTIHAFGKDSAPAFGFTGDRLGPCRLAFVIPNFAEDTVLLPTPTIIRASHGSTFSFDGLDIKVAGGGTLDLTVLNQGNKTQQMIDRFLSLSVPKLRLVYSKSTEKFIVLASPKDVLPVSLSVIPLSISPAPTSTVHIPLVTCKSLVLSPSRISIFSSLTTSCHFFTESSNDPDTLTLTLSSSGAQFTVSPVCTLSSTTNAEEYHVALLTSYKPLSPLPSEATDLPTPPPSPHPRVRFLPTQSDPRTQAPSKAKDISKRGLTRLLPRLVVLFVVLLVKMWILPFGTFLGLDVDKKKDEAREKTGEKDVVVHAADPADRPESQGSNSSEAVRIEVMGGHRHVAALSRAASWASHPDLAEALSKAKMTVRDMTKRGLTGLVADLVVLCVLFLVKMWILLCGIFLRLGANPRKDEAREKMRENAAARVDRPEPPSSDSTEAVWVEVAGGPRRVAVLSNAGPTSRRDLAFEVGGKNVEPKVKMVTAREGEPLRAWLHEFETGGVVERIKISVATGN